MKRGKFKLYYHLTKIYIKIKNVEKVVRSHKWSNHNAEHIVPFLWKIRDFSGLERDSQEMV